MIEKGVYEDIVTPWQPHTLLFVPAANQMVEAAKDRLLAGQLAYRWAVCFDKFGTGGDTRDSNEARQLMNELAAMAEPDGDPANTADNANQTVTDLGDRLNDVLTGGTY